MPKIPQAGVFIARDTGPAGVLANPNMQDAEFAGMQQLGRGISQAGAALGEYAQKMEYASYVAKKNEADRKVKTAWTTYQEKMLTETATPETWAKGWNDMYAKVRKEVALDGLSKESRARVEAQMLDFQLDSTAQISAQATKQRIRNGQAEITASATLDLKNGDFESYEAKINEGAAAGFFDPAIQIKLMEEGRVQFDVENANKAINENPIAATSALEEKTDGGKWRNFKNVSENQRLSLLVEAKRRTSDLRAETSRGIYERRSNGELIEPQELEGLVAQGLMTPHQAKNVMSEQKRSGDDPEVMPKFSAALRAVSEYDPRKDPEKTQFAQLVQERAWFPADMKQELEKRLNAQVSLSSDKTVGDVSVRNYVNAMLDDGIFGDIGKFPANDAKRAGKVRDPAAYQKAHATHVEIMGSLQQFMADNPTATPTQQREFVDGKLTTLTTTAASLPILNAIAGKSQTNARGQQPAKAGKYKVIKVGE